MRRRGDYKSLDEESAPPNPFVLGIALLVILLGFWIYFGIETYAQFFATTVDVVEQGKIVKLKMHPFRDEYVTRDNVPVFYFALITILIGVSIYIGFSKPSVKESPKHPVP